MQVSASSEIRIGDPLDKPLWEKVGSDSIRCGAGIKRMTGPIALNSRVSSYRRDAGFPVAAQVLALHYYANHRGKLAGPRQQFEGCNSRLPDARR